ncbi:MAG: shikimate dehydrogenase [Alphaproteobacteria bacterium]
MITGKARIAGVVGWPVDHSRSPQLHNFWLDRYGIDGAYVPLAVTPENLSAALGALPALKFAGVNVTVPHKEAALALVDAVDDNARRIGAVNTIVVDEAGRLIGSNTDGFGFMENLRAGAPQWSAAGGPAVVLGAGGAARSVAAALHDAGVPEIRIVNRTAERAERLVADLGAGLNAVPWRDREAALDGAALLINTTILGMEGGPPLELALDALPGHAVVSDIVYTPLQTDLLQSAQARGLTAVDGIGMLLHQARPGFAAWFGRDPEVDDALRAHVLAGAA